MRQDFRVKADISRIYQDARQFSWVFIDSLKILRVHHLADHVEKLFNIKKPFHLLSRNDETNFFLPFEEDVRVLENNDTVIIVPGTGINTSLQVEKTESTLHQSVAKSVRQTHEASCENGFLVPHASFKGKDSNTSSEKSYGSENSLMQNDSMQTTIENNTSGISFTGSLYRTALHETILDDTKDVKVTNPTQSNNIAEDSTVSSKRKRIRKRRHRNPTTIVQESDTENSGKKPKIVNSIVISSGKHIRFQSLDGGETTSDNNAPSPSNIQQVKQNGDAKHKQNTNKDLAALLNLRQSSTPLTFQHKKIKKDYKIETINKSKSDNVSSSESMVEPESVRENSTVNKSAANDDTVSFKVFRLGEDYSPQLSSMIIAKVLSKNLDGSQYTMKILHGKEQLQDPEGKFSLPKEDRHDSDDDNVVILEKSKLLEFTKISAFTTPT